MHCTLQNATGNARRPQAEGSRREGGFGMTSASHDQGARPRPYRDILLFLGLAAALCIDQIMLGPYAAVSFFDTIEIHFPMYRLLGTLTLEHGLFSWNPLLCGGLPSFASQHPPYAPPALLATVMPLWILSLAWNLLRAFVAGYGMHRMLEGFLGLDKRAAILGGALFAVACQSGLVLAVMSYSLPLLCTWTRDLAGGGQSRAIRWLKAAGLLFLSSLSYPVLSLPYAPVLHLALVLLFRRDDPFLRRHVALVFLLWTAYVLLFVPNLLELYNFVPYVHRGYATPYDGAAQALLQTLRLVFNAFRSNAYLPLLVFALPTMLASKRLRPVFAFAVLPVVVFNPLMPGTQLLHLLEGSFILKMDLSNIRFFSEMTLILGFGAAFDDMLRSGKRPDWRWGLVAAASAFASGRVQDGITGLFLLGAFWGGLLALASASRAARSRPSPAACWMLFVFCLCGWTMMTRQQFLLQTQSMPYSRIFENHPQLAEIAKEQRQTPFRVACLDFQPVVALGNGLDTLGQKGPLFNKHYKHYAKLVILPQLERLDQVEWYDSFWHHIYFGRTEDRAPFVTRVTLTPRQPRSIADFNLPLLLAMNVRYILSTSPVEGLEAHSDQHLFLPGRSLPLAPSGSQLDAEYSLPLHVYRLQGSFERGYLVRQSQTFTSDEDLAAVLAGQDTPSLRDVVFISGPASATGMASAAMSFAGEQAGPGQIALVQHGPDRLVFKGDISEPCSLVVTNNYHPNWTARINGSRVPVQRANLSFQAIAIPTTGPVTIELDYAAPLLRWAHAATGLGILLFLLLAAWRQANDGQKPPSGTASNCASVSPSRILTGAMLSGVVWTAAYLLFVFGRNVGKSDRPLVYLLCTTPLLALALGAWACSLNRFLSRNPNMAAAAPERVDSAQETNRA